MIKWLMDLPWVYSGIILVGTFILLALLGLVLTRRYVSSKTLRACHDVAGFTFGIIGVIYGVLLGFTVVEVNDRFHEAEQNILQETALLMELFRDAGAFNAQDRDKIQKLIRDYAQVVYEDEWYLMADEKESEKARELIYAIWTGYKDLTPQSDKERSWYDLSLQKLNDISQHRVLRIFHTHQSLGPLMWTLLLTGACITVMFMYFFSAESILVQGLMTSLLAGTIGFMLFLVLSLDGIYSGDVSLRPTELVRALERFNETLTQAK